MTNNFDLVMTMLTDALYAIYGDLLDSVFSFFYAADDIDENTIVNVGIVLVGKPTQKMEELVTEQIQQTNANLAESFRVRYLTPWDYHVQGEEIEISSVYFENGKKLDRPANRTVNYASVIWQDETDKELPM